MNRRAFLVAAGSAGVAPALTGGVAGSQPAPASASDRDTWVGVTRRLADPVLGNLANGTLKARCRSNRRPARIAGTSPISRRSAGCWRASRRGSSCRRMRPRRGQLPAKYADLAAARDRARGRSVIAGLHELLQGRAAAGRRRVSRAGDAARAEGAGAGPRSGDDEGADRGARIDARRSRRASTTGCCSRRPSRQALARLGARWDRMRVDYALRQHEQWYKGDGVYGDGPVFHWDYYNSFVIQPMLLDVLDVGRDESAGVEGDRRHASSAAPPLCRDPRAARRARRHVPAGRTVDCLSLRRLSVAGADGAAAAAARRRDSGAGARRADGDDQAGR